MTGPGPRWIGCRIKGSPILTTQPPSPESHLQRTKEGNPSTTILESFKSTAPFGRFHIYRTSLDTNFAFASRVLLSPPEISSSEPCLRGQVLLICLVNKANLSGECLRIKFIWTSFSARPPPPYLLLQAE